MGISQLLPFLEKSTRNCHVSEFRGQTVAVDTYCWLHKGARSCALQLAKGDQTDAYVQYCMKYVQLLLSYDIKPIMVFDGRPLPAKAGTEEKRRETKAQARKQGMDYLRLGQTKDAYKSFCQCVDVTPEMALEVIKACRRISVDYIVAPYEADAQLAFFNITKVADCVISEDSDLLLFGCQRVLYKMDFTGAGQLVEAEKLHVSMKLRREQYTFQKFRHMCILSGCDYLDSLPGIGLKKALKFISMTAEADPLIFIDRIPRYLNMKSLTVPEEYKENFRVADATFLHQVVFDPAKKILLHLQAVEINNQYCRNAGQMFDNDQAFQLAIGNLNPLNMKRIDNWDPSEMLRREFSVWSPDGKIRPKPTPRYNPSKNLLSKNIDLKVTEKANEELDKMVENELEFYKTPVKVQVALIEHNSPESAAAESETSPVLGTNPFVKKKLSKFQVTQQNCRRKVISRFFSPNLGVREQTSSFRSSSGSPALTSESGYEDDIPEISENEVSSTVTSNGSARASNGNSLEASSSENLSMTVHTDDLSQVDTDTTDSSDEPHQVECECILEVEDTEMKIGAASTTLISVENIPSEPPTKKRKLQPEVRAKKRSAKQATIKDMFKKMRMN